MKYIKKFENISNKPKIGDYILMKEFGNSLVSDFINNNIGIVKNIIINDFVDVNYSYVPENIAHFFRDYGTRFYIDQIVDFDENLENLKIKIKANKYNL